MFSELNYKITVDKVSQKAIERLVDIIGDSPIELNNSDIVDILFSIADKRETDVEDIILEYE